MVPVSMRASRSPRLNFRVVPPAAVMVTYYQAERGSSCLALCRASTTFWRRQAEVAGNWTQNSVCSDLAGL